MCVLSLASSRAISEACAESEERKLKKTCYRLNSARTALSNANYASVHGHRMETRRARPPPCLASSSAGLSPSSAFDPVSPAREGFAVSGLHPPTTKTCPFCVSLCVTGTPLLLRPARSLTFPPPPGSVLPGIRVPSTRRVPALSKPGTQGSDLLVSEPSPALTSHMTLVRLPL